MTLPKNLCLAPFTYITFDPATNVSPCPALGGSVWNFRGQSFEKIWSNNELTAFRSHMLADQKHEVCHRCWDEEAVGMTSERTRHWNPSIDPAGTQTNILETHKTPVDAIDPANYTQGPMQLIIKVGNICNLRCRSCNSADSVTLAVEGQHYSDKHGWKNNFYLKETETKVFTDQQIEEIANFCHNVVRIEFYGGEPLLDKQLPKLLQKLVERGYASKINLNISTNCTHQMSNALIETLSQFNHVNINLSIDGWGDQFTYLRHPGKWQEAYNNVKWFIALRDSDKINLSLLVATTVTTMNVYDLPDFLNKVKVEFDLPVFLILAWFPFYYSIKNIPDAIAQNIAAKLQRSNLPELDPIIEALLSAPMAGQWDIFKRWTGMVDEYRKESFSTTFAEYSNMITLHDREFSL